MTTVRKDFTGLFDFADACKAPGLPSAANHSTQNSASATWDLNAGFDAAMKMAASGWQEGVDRVSAIAERLLERLQRQTRRSKREAGVFGQRVHIGRFLAGNPRNMIRKRREPAKRPVRMLVNISASGGVNADTLATRGAVIVACVQALTMAGYAVEVTAVEHASGGGDTSVYTVALKSGGAPMDADALSFALCHPAMLRRLMFRMSEQNTPRMTHSGYGMPQTYSEDGAIVMPCMRYRDHATELCATEDGAFAYALEILKEAGMTVD